MATDFITGIDIGSFAIKAVVLAHTGTGKQPKLVSFGSIIAPQPGIASESIVDMEAEAKAVTNLLGSIKSPNSSVVIALPESKIFTRVIGDLPYLSDDEIASAIRYSAEEFVPLPVDQVNLYWQVVARSKQENNTLVFVVASPKNIVKKYLKILNLAKLRPLALETELIASTRALVGGNPFAPSTLIIQM